MFNLILHYFEEPVGENPVFPCGICTKNINTNHKTIKCSNCSDRVHIKCNKIGAKTFESKNLKNEIIICLKCQDEILPFQRLSDEQFFVT